jgi:uncharacterized protein (TIGR00255 family)
MTGFGRGRMASATLVATVEVSSVNRKQAEVVVQLPRSLAELDAPIRKAILARISRGRLAATITLERPDGVPAPLQVNRPLALALDRAFAELSTALGRSVLPEAADFLRTPGIIQVDSTVEDPDAAWLVIEPALADALDQLINMRTAEGADLAADLRARLARVADDAQQIAALAHAVPARQRESLLRRLRDANLEFDSADDRLIREIALFAERCDISEELTRLHSHLARFLEYLAQNDALGRSLDFLCQELNRELNTIGSKANDADIAQFVVTAKTELEKIREQVQNVE